MARPKGSKNKPKDEVDDFTSEVFDGPEEAVEESVEVSEKISKSPKKALRAQSSASKGSYENHPKFAKFKQGVN